MLEVSDLHAYYGKSHILQGVDMRIDAGEVVSLLGARGARFERPPFPTMLPRLGHGVVTIGNDHDDGGQVPDQLVAIQFAFRQQQLLA